MFITSDNETQHQQYLAKRKVFDDDYHIVENFFPRGQIEIRCSDELGDNMWFEVYLDRPNRFSTMTTINDKPIKIIIGLDSVDAKKNS